MKEREKRTDRWTRLTQICKPKFKETDRDVANKRVFGKKGNKRQTQ